MSATELQRDEEKAAALSIARKPLVVPPTGQDPALSVNHPFYDVARHGILQVAGGLQLGGPRIPDRCQRSRGPRGVGGGFIGLPPRCLPLLGVVNQGQCYAASSKGTNTCPDREDEPPLRPAAGLGERVASL